MSEPTATEEPTTPPESATVTVLRQAVGAAVLEVIEYRGETTVVLSPDKIVEACTALRDAPDLKYNFLADITAVDWLERVPRFDIVYHLLSIATKAVVRLKLRIGEEDEVHPAVPTVVSVWKGANWYEREIFDLFGITFTDHPDMRRILMPDDWVSHPLRKDYPLTGITLPDPHWGGQVPIGQDLPEGTGRQTLRTSGGVLNQFDSDEIDRQHIEGRPEGLPTDEKE